ncbi:MAG: glucose-6-phosphate isomerase, partial [Prochloraceae cyanobacterium]|nr:glucose-6-phosphate isomerase [Prochloraceae cyanobacterium]
METLWQRYQDWLYYHAGLGMYLDVSRMRFTPELVETLKPKFDKAFQDMEALEKGAIANPDENRMVGHYWLRNPDLAPTSEIRQEIVKGIEQIETFARQVRDGSIRPPEASQFTDLLTIGIGGSALGPQFVASALAPDKPPLAIHFIDNTDPAGIDRVLNKIRDRLKSTLVIDTSKSGGTPEPRNGMLETKHAFEEQGLNFARHAVATTMAGSKMDQLARQEGWLAEFPMFDWIGGRTSEMSAVGLLPAALQNIDIRALLAGAKTMDEATRVRDLKNNPAALLAFCWYYAGDGQGKKDMVILPYKDSLLLFSRYLQQLVMESLGKEKDLDSNTVHQGLAVYGNKGSTDQHAYVQQLREGIPNFFATFIEVLEDRQGESIEVETGATSGDFLSGFLLGTRQALYENQRDSITITIPQVNPRTVGGLIALYERAVSFYASLVNINAYHQPGVEAGKKAAASILDLQKRVMQVLKGAEEPLSLAVLAEKANAAEEV